MAQTDAITDPNSTYTPPKDPGDTIGVAGTATLDGSFIVIQITWLQDDTETTVGSPETTTAQATSGSAIVWSKDIFFDEYPGDDNPNGAYVVRVRFYDSILNYPNSPRNTLREPIPR